MAYSLRYYKEIAHDDGTVIRLEIHKKGGYAEAIEIGGVVQELSLQIQGQQGDIDTPIIKTSLSMTFVDADDIDDGRKNGFWEEFYTPDAVYWQVILKAKKPKETSFRTIWGGYVTPDSFSENLVYRGSINIIARDNIGHMQDFPFDATGDENGMISLHDLVNEAWAKIQSPMQLAWRGAEDEDIWMECNGVVAYNTLMNVSAFEGMNWYEAVEKALYSYGVVMRYVGDNFVQMSSLRYMPYQGYYDLEAVTHLTPVFISGANRELRPAIKRIEESVSYDLETSALMPRVEEADFTGTEGSYQCKIEGVDMGFGKFGTAQHAAPVWPISNGGWGNVASSTLFFNPYNYEIGYFSERKDQTEEILRYMYIAANNVDNRNVWFVRRIECADLTVRIKFGLPISLNAQKAIEQQDCFHLKRITYAIYIEQGGVTEYLCTDGGWRAGYQELVYEYDDTVANFDFEQFVPMGDYVGNATITLSIIKIEYSQTSYASKAQYGLYACIQALSFDSPESSSLLETNHVNTLYNDANNVILRRDPEFGPAYNTVAIPQFIKNGIFIYENGNIVPAKKWNWVREQQYQQMAVFNHLQLLCYYGYPHNILSGTIVNADVTNVACIYTWQGAYHLLQSGSYNFLNGHIENAVLREISFYNNFWEIPEEDKPDTEEGSEGNAGKSSGSSPLTYNNTTTVTIGKGTGTVNILNNWDAYNPTANQVLGANLGIELYDWLEWIEDEGWGDSIDDINDELYYINEDIAELDGRVTALEKNPGGGGVSYEGITGIMVNGQTYEDTDNDKVIVLPDYPTTVAELTDSADYAKVSDLEDIIDDIESIDSWIAETDDAIIALQAEDERLAAIIANLGAVAEMFVWDDEEHTRIRTDYDFFSKKTISSGGKAAPSGEGGGGSIDLSDYATIDYVDSNFLPATYNSYSNWYEIDANIYVGENLFAASMETNDLYSYGNFWAEGDVGTDGNLEVWGDAKFYGDVYMSDDYSLYFAQGVRIYGNQSGLNLDAEQGDILLHSYVEASNGMSVWCDGEEVVIVGVDGLYVTGEITASAGAYIEGDLSVAYGDIYFDQDMGIHFHQNTYVYSTQDGLWIEISQGDLHVNAEIISPTISDILDRLDVIEVKLGI